MEGYDLEIGPIQKTFDKLYKSISQYFNSHEVEPKGIIKEHDLSYHSQDKLRKSLSDTLQHYGFTELPSAMRITVEEDSEIKGIQRSDDIVVYEQTLDGRFHRIFNFYKNNGPENMQSSFYWLNMKVGGEQIQGILTDDDRWYLRINTNKNKYYYLRIEKS